MRDESRDEHSARASEDDGTPLSETNYDAGRVVEAVIDAIATVSDAPPTEMEPLYESISPDALEAIFARPLDGRAPTRVKFQHQGFDVVIDGDGRIAIYDSD